MTSNLNQISFWANLVAIGIWPLGFRWRLKRPTTPSLYLKSKSYNCSFGNYWVNQAGSEKKVRDRMTEVGR